MGGYLDIPKVEKNTQTGEGNEIIYGTSTMQGWRETMEDAHVCNIGLPDYDNWCYFAIFDGHAGNNVSTYCAENLLNNILDTQMFKSGHIEGGIETGFWLTDERIRTLNPDSPTKAGSTAICVFITPQHIYYANCGDSRAAICRCGEACFATRDHKPDLDGERQRIYAAGGCVITQRVNGVLAVSRSFGDYELKLRHGNSNKQLVTPQPDIYTRRRHDTDNFLVLACDGIWDVMDTEKVCSFIYSQLLLTNDVVAIANLVVDTCLNMGSRDNMSITIILFPGAPTVSPIAVKRERQHDNRLIKLIKDEIEEFEIRTYPELLEHLHKRTDIENLPPGGGLFAKYVLIQQVYQEVYPKDDLNMYSAYYGGC